MDALQAYLAQGLDPSHVTGLDPVFAGALAPFLAAAPAGAITINSGHRSDGRQAELYRAALAKYGSEAEARRWVAPPGKSNHNHGAASDLGYANDAAREWAHANAAAYGLNFRMGHEPWHVELADGYVPPTTDAPVDPAADFASMLMPAAQQQPAPSFTSTLAPQRVQTPNLSQAPDVAALLEEITAASAQQNPRG